MSDVQSPSEQSANALQTITGLIDWGGGWAARALFDDAVRRKLSSEPMDPALARKVAQAASGRSAHKQMINYQRLTGDTFRMKIPEPVAPGTVPLLDFSLLRKRFVSGREAERCLEALCEHLRCSRRWLRTKINQTLGAEPRPTPDAISHMRTWSWPLISRVLGFSLPMNAPQLEFVQSTEAALCWKRWYQRTDGTLVLLETPDMSGLRTSQWLVWRLIHDATHLLHISKFPETANYLNPKAVWIMESLAMLTERRVLALLDRDWQIHGPANFRFDTTNIKTVLLLGQIERALRLEYDIAVHADGMSVREWMETTLKRTGVDPSSLSFAEEFAGLPGLSAAYFAGMIAMEETENIESVLTGGTDLVLSPIAVQDPLSRSKATDIPNKRPIIEVALTKVGIDRATSMVCISHPTTGVESSVMADIAVSVNLASSQRGIHMSRLQEAIHFASIERGWLDLTEMARVLADRCKQTQAATWSNARIGTQVLVPSITQHSAKESSYPMQIWGSATIEGPTSIAEAGLSLGVVTACPCTLAYSQLKLREATGCADLRIPTFTHSQPGNLRVSVSGSAHLPNLGALHAAIARTAHIRQSVLKREDEHALVRDVHARPQFCEDLCRAAAVAVAAICGPDVLVRVEAVLDESIHPHRASALLELQASAIWMELPSDGGT